MSSTSWIAFRCFISSFIFLHKKYSFRGSRWLLLESFEALKSECEAWAAGWINVRWYTAPPFPPESYYFVLLCLFADLDEMVWCVLKSSCRVRSQKFCLFALLRCLLMHISRSVICGAGCQTLGWRLRLQREKISSVSDHYDVKRVSLPSEWVLQGVYLNFCTISIHLYTFSFLFRKLMWILHCF